MLLGDALPDGRQNETTAWTLLPTTLIARARPLFELTSEAPSLAVTAWPAGLKE